LRKYVSSARSFAWGWSLLLLAFMLFTAGLSSPRAAAAQQPATAADAGQPAENPSAASQPVEKQGAEAARSKELEELDVYRHASIVQTIGREMGLRVEATARVFEAINFLILLLAIAIPVMRIMPKVLRKRSATLNQDIQTAREATADANARLSAVEAKLAGLDAEIQKYRAQIEQESRQDEARIKASLGEESERIVAAAGQEIEQAAAQARRGLRHFAADLAIAQAEKQLVLTPEVDRALIDEFIAGVNKGGSN
jgi:F-type H+-transporting ATPase subunit b